MTRDAHCLAGRLRRVGDSVPRVAVRLRPRRALPRPRRLRVDARGLQLNPGLADDSRPPRQPAQSKRPTVAVEPLPPEAVQQFDQAVFA